MANVPNTSFIPKRGPSRQTRGTRTRQVHVFTIVSYIILFATLVASGGVFLYDRYIANQLTAAVSILNTEIADFSEADMQRVQDYSQRLSQAESRLNASVSIPTIFTALERSTLNSVQLNTLSIERTDETFLLSTTLETDSFDSSLFQRSILNREGLISTLSFSDVDISESTEETITQSPTQVVLTAKMEITAAAIPYIPNEAIRQDFGSSQTEEIPTPQIDLPATAETEDLNETDL